MYRHNVSEEHQSHKKKGNVTMLPEAPPINSVAAVVRSKASDVGGSYRSCCGRTGVAEP